MAVRSRLARCKRMRLCGGRQGSGRWGATYSSAVVRLRILRRAKSVGAVLNKRARRLPRFSGAPGARLEEALHERGRRKRHGFREQSRIQSAVLPTGRTRSCYDFILLALGCTILEFCSTRKLSATAPRSSSPRPSTPDTPDKAALLTSWRTTKQC
jgi:hypothetical protein